MSVNWWLLLDVNLVIGAMLVVFLRSNPDFDDIFENVDVLDQFGFPIFITVAGPTLASLLILWHSLIFRKRTA